MIANLAAQFRAHPIATALELGSVLVCFLLFVGTLVLLSSGAPTGRGEPWLALIGIGAAFVVFWTALVPLYERTM
ncbi:hypothetical protein GS429_05285 [Natronorubrum sp. JWXQ-INN-674]|uniref:Uncharacterized protein n=1 Tax=Natronorubrum halalkaliphilum TaxID=2691917 RepID=A0A6B0VK34_9EURY|nr:hypothetical protein [Natronorubrum halalkaliphilum]MXV61485.1 hypothetical protein [Natronorubrum halalkaliphilum]